MEELKIETLDYIVRFTDEDNVIRKLSEDGFTYHKLPEGKRTNYGNADINCIKSINNIDFSENLRMNRKGFTYKQAHHRDLVSVAEYLLELKRQEDYGWHKLSSSTAEKNGDAVIFFGGATNLGKTTSALELVKNYDFNLYSDEKTIIELSKGDIISGCKSMANRKQINKKDSGMKGEYADHKETSFGTKNTRLVMYPHIDHGLETPIYYKMEQPDFHWLLMRELGNTSRAGHTYFNNYSEPVDSLDNKDLARKRISDAGKFTSNVDCYYFQGSKEQIASFVNDYFSKGL